MSQHIASGDQSIGVLTSTSVLPMNIQDSTLLGWTAWISLQSKGLLRVFSSKAFLSLLAILWNSAFKWAYLSFSPLPFTSLLFSAICKVSSDNYFAILHFFFLGMILVTTSCTMLQTSIHSSSGTLSTRSNPLNLFITAAV